MKAYSFHRKERTAINADAFKKRESSVIRNVLFYLYQKQAHVLPFDEKTCFTGFFYFTSLRSKIKSVHRTLFLFYFVRDTLAIGRERIADVIPCKAPALQKRNRFVNLPAV